MPIPGHLSLIGEQQGAIEGSCDLDRREGTILVQAFHHLVEVPTDSSGVPSGRRAHRPATITKEIDKATPKLYQALCMGERLKEVRLDWYRLDQMGSQELYFVVRFEHAFITAVKPWVPNALDPASAGLRHMEDVSFTYEKIIWSWEPDGIEFEDDWGEMGGK